MNTQFGEEITARILAGRRRRLFGSSPLYEPYRGVAGSDLDAVEKRLGHVLPEGLRSFLLVAGYGDINEVLSLREDWFSVIESGELAGHVTFAQDDGGNFYTFCPTDGRVHFVCRSFPEYAPMAAGFYEFLRELEQHSFHIEAWTSGLNCLPYHWST